MLAEKTPLRKVTLTLKKLRSDKNKHSHKTAKFRNGSKCILIIGALEINMSVCLCFQIGFSAQNDNFQCIIFM